MATLAAVVAASIGYALFGSARPPREDFTRLPPVIGPDLLARSSLPPAEGATCATTDCHADIVTLWTGSQHARANRLPDPALDGPAFAGGRRQTIQPATGFRTVATTRRGNFIFDVTTPGGARSRHRVEAAIGVEPLVQYLVTAPGGRLQTVDAAWDVHSREIFHSFEDLRQPGEWGYWRGRSMNWNSQCAFCHMTGFVKNYDPATDAYASTWDAMAISCAQCHGPMPEHVARPRDPVVPAEQLTATVPLVEANCASCHSRRSELTGAFRPGEAYADHYRPALVDDRDVYYPDGQVRDENFEYGSFLMSRMHHKGVTCLDCHDPHSAELKAPADNNAACMVCHAAPGQRGATVIADPLAHGRHEADNRGSLCIECHMPVTRYMVRDPRRDHGFTIPDPLLTRELGIPNACNRCHDDQTVDWSIEWMEKWYGPRMERRARDRARVVARARAGDLAAAPLLLDLLRTEEVAGWRASLAGLLAYATGEPTVTATLQELLADPDPLVRAAAARSLADLPSAPARLAPLLADPVRGPRLDAAWAVTRHGAPLPPAVEEELQRELTHGSDQPTGALRRAQLALTRGDPAGAVAWSAKAAAWDGSAGGHLLHARFLHAAGRPAEAAAALRAGLDLEPANAEVLYTLSLLLAEQGASAEVVRLLERTVAADPSFARAWYNLGLALDAQGDRFGALRALARAEEADLRSPDAPYAAATILAQLGRTPEAMAAARRALARDPAFAPASSLLQALAAP